MASDFLTLEKSDPQFSQYIDGRFSQNTRALPEKSFGTGTQERITFRLVPIGEIEKPNKLKIIGLALRPNFLTLTLAPVLVATLYLMSQGQTPHWQTVALSLLALMFFHFSVFLFNDYYDHVNGQDRTNPKRGSQIIQKGWEPAYRIKQWAWLNLSLGVAVGSYLAISSSQLLFFVGGIALLTVLLFPWLRDLKTGPFAELLIFLCFGPLLVAGYLTAIQIPIRWPLMIMGGVYGALAVICVHMKYLENLFHESMSGSRHLLARIGLDKGKALVIVEIVLATFWLVAWLFSAHVYWFLGLICIAPAALLITRLTRVRSPMSSSIKGLTQWGLWWHLGVSLVMAGIFLIRQWQ